MTARVIPFAIYLNGLHTDYFNISCWKIYPRGLLIENFLAATFYVLRTSDAELFYAYERRQLVRPPTDKIGAEGGSVPS